MANRVEASQYAVARQAILGRRGELLGYELLYRSGQVQDHVAATARVLLSSLGDIGLDRLVGPVPAFVNVSREFLLAGEPLPVDPDRVVLELLENQHIDEALLSSMRALRESGFRFALDDFTYTPESEPLLGLAWAVKLDVRALSPAALREHLHRLGGRGLCLLAEKVETHGEHEEYLELGFDAFQGFFYTRPQLVRGRAATTMNVNSVRELLALGADASLEDIERLIVSDAGLSIRLLRLANSASIAPRSRITSLRHALMLLGARTVWRWALLLSLADIGDRPRQLLVTALERARFCELDAANQAIDPASAFTVGLLSVADALLDRPMIDVVDELGLHARLADALLEHSGPEGRVLARALAHEHGEELSGVGISAAAWADELTSSLALLSAA